MSDIGNVESEAKNRDSSLGDLVVVGSSTGGLEALSILVSKLSVDFPAPILIAQHLDPSRPSTLDTFLRRHTTLPVELIASISPLEKGKIYVVPSNRLVTIEDGHVKVQKDQLKRQRPRPSLDVLLTSAAGVYGERLIAVILTGSGSDGATGAVEVKNAGGTVIVQDPQMARYPSMPLALPPTAIDFEADIEQIGPLLYDLLTGIDLPRNEERTHGNPGIWRLEGRANNDATKVIGKPLVEPESLSPQFEIGQLQRLNELLLRFLPVGIVVTDRSYHVVTANGTARRLLGLRGLNSEQDFLHAVRGIPYTTVRAAIDGVFREHNDITLPEIELDISTGGNGRFISISIALMQMEAGLPDLAALSVTDVTEQAQARQELEHLNKLKDEFLSLASHELRTPLTSILGDAQLAQRDLKRQEAIASTETQAQGIQQAENNLDRIVHQTKRMGRLINEMLDITRIRGDMFELKTSEDLNLVELVRRVVEQMKATADRSIVLEANEESIRGTFDADRIEQVLNNLIDNAVKYSPPDKPVEVRIERQFNEATIRVRDQGPGISKEEQELIFKRFYRAHSEDASETEGLGLGLYIAHKIVIRLGGRVWLESQPGEGSTFYLSLPLANQE